MRLTLSDRVLTQLQETGEAVVEDATVGAVMAGLDTLGIDPQRARIICKRPLDGEAWVVIDS